MSDSKTLAQLSEIGAALADIAESLEGQRTDPELATALADLVEVLEGLSAQPIADAIQYTADAQAKGARGLEYMAKAITEQTRALSVIAERRPAARSFDMTFEPEYAADGSIVRVRVVGEPRSPP